MPQESASTATVNQYRSKQVVINAVQLTDAQSVEVIAVWSGGTPIGDSAVDIPTLEGVMRADMGAWVIRGLEGEFYPCKDSVFRAKYDPISGAWPEEGARLIEETNDYVELIDNESDARC